MYIACEELNFLWGEKQVEVAVELWKSGYSVVQMAKELKRTQAEVVILILDLSMQKRIKQRLGGLWGSVV